MFSRLLLATALVIGLPTWLHAQHNGIIRTAWPATSGPRATDGNRRDHRGRDARRIMVVDANNKS